MSGTDANVSRAERLVTKDTTGTMTAKNAQTAAKLGQTYTNGMNTNVLDVVDGGTPTLK